MSLNDFSLMYLFYTGVSNLSLKTTRSKYTVNIRCILLFTSYKYKTMYLLRELNTSVRSGLLARLVGTMRNPIIHTMHND